MSSVVDICNLALSYLGDEATVTAIDPIPDGSAQAALCARFYPISRNSLLEMHSWGFATVRFSMSELSSASVPPQWQHAYAIPSDAINLLAVIDSAAGSDYSVAIPTPFIPPGTINANIGNFTPQPFVAETLLDGTQVIFTNQENAMLLYTRLVTDATKFTPLFTEALAWLLASKLAGPILKGATGRDEAKRCVSEFRAVFGRATASDANQRRLNVAPNTNWLASR